MKFICGTSAKSQPDTLTAYDLVFLGSACHDADLARPVKQILEQIPTSPAFKLAGFATHASYTPEGGDRERQIHEDLGLGMRAVLPPGQPGEGIDFLGYFGCQGAPSPAIEQFIHSTIVTDEDEWAGVCTGGKKASRRGRFAEGEGVR